MLFVPKVERLSFGMRQLQTLQDICSNWERCQKAFEEVSKELPCVRAEVVFSEDCMRRFPFGWTWPQEMKDLQDQGMQVGGPCLSCCIDLRHCSTQGLARGSLVWEAAGSHSRTEISVTL